ncbi:hypothetical protein, partial [Mesorhizobium sp.]|uniref:hypothetical protein n=1 Tax=Mesorhizobium sp. TaxID=1871066 RepID=UPI00257F1071
LLQQRPATARLSSHGWGSLTAIRHCVRGPAVWPAAQAALDLRKRRRLFFSTWLPARSIFFAGKRMKAPKDAGADLRPQTNIRRLQKHCATPCDEFM